MDTKNKIKEANNVSFIIQQSLYFVDVKWFDGLFWMIEENRNGFVGKRDRVFCRKSIFKHLVNREIIIVIYMHKT